MSYIEINDLSYAYGDGENRKVALRGIDLKIEKGSFTAVLGHNGSGKSTLAKLLCSILVPEEGSIKIDGKEITDPDMSEEELLELHRRIGMVFQNPDNQLVATVVEEDIAFGPENLGMPPSQIRKKVDEVMELMGLTAYARHAPSKLSGGQKQRVAIAGILAMQPETMIFDEATAMLDPRGRKEVMDTILRLNRDLGITVIHITHNMEEALCADRVLVIDEGQIALDGTPAEVFTQTEKMRATGLDVQPCTKLLYALKQEGIGIDDRSIDPDECAAIIYGRYLQAARPNEKQETTEG